MKLLRWRWASARLHTEAIRAQSINMTAVSSIGERQKTMLSKINIKQFSRVAKIHLVNIVIDGFPGTRSKMGNGEPIIGEAREPPSLGRIRLTLS